VTSVLVAAAFGLAFGSFANAAIDRLPRGRSLQGRSACDSCGRELGVLELIPVLSYAALRGRCAGCGAAIGARTPLIEAACGAAFAMAFALMAVPAAVAACAIFVCALVGTGAALRRPGEQA
jgi:leader peptidase (prepilin peptidase)/N-methyltransferase